MTNREWMNSLSNEDFTKEMYKILKISEEAFLLWLKSEHIKQCPCCGGVAVIHHIEQQPIYGFLECNKCGLKTSTVLIGEALKLWNTRVGDE
jgi:ribosomal protein S27AE